MIDDEGKLAVKMPLCIYLPVQLYPSPSKPRLQAQTGRLPLCWQNAFGPQDGEHEGKTAEKKKKKQQHMATTKQQQGTICLNNKMQLPVQFFPSPSKPLKHRQI